MIDLKALKALFDDDVLVRKYIDRFAEDMPGLLQTMRKASDVRKWDELSIHAHSYKSQMQYINETDAADIATALEKISEATDHDAEKIHILIHQLEDHLTKLLPALKQLNV